MTFVLLATDGYLLIAETTKSMKGRLSEGQTMSQNGFKPERFKGTEYP